LGIFSGEVTLSNKKVSTTVYITQDQSQQLKELHARTKVPVAEYIRQGIDKVLEENADKLPGQLSLMQ
jgi:predicted DNA-binding protein